MIGSMGDFVCWLSVLVYFLCCFFFFKQKTAYEMRMSDWSSDVCSSDLRHQQGFGARGHRDAMACAGVRAQRRFQLFDFGAHDVLTVVEHGLDARVDGVAQHLVLLFKIDELHGRRSEERRVGKEGVSTLNSCGSQCPSTKNRSTN